MYRMIGFRFGMGWPSLMYLAAIVGLLYKPSNSRVSWVCVGLACISLSWLTIMAVKLYRRLRMIQPLMTFRKRLGEVFSIIASILWCANGIGRAATLPLDSGWLWYWLSVACLSLLGINGWYIGWYSVNADKM